MWFWIGLQEKCFSSSLIKLTAIRWSKVHCFSFHSFYIELLNKIPFNFALLFQCRMKVIIRIDLPTNRQASDNYFSVKIEQPNSPLDRFSNYFSRSKDRRPASTRQSRWRLPTRLLQRTKNIQSRAIGEKWRWWRTYQTVHRFRVILDRQVVRFRQTEATVVLSRGPSGNALKRVV